MVVSCLQSLAFETNLCPATTSAKAALVQSYDAREWTEASLAAAAATQRRRGEGQFFDELASSAAATVRAANLLASSDKLR